MRLNIQDIRDNESSRIFCEEFINSKKPKFIFGRNEFAESIQNFVDIDGFIDDFTDEVEYLGKPIVPVDLVPSNALVVIVVIGKPLIAEKRVSQFQFRSLDYYSFYKYSKLPLKNIMFWDGFVEKFDRHKDKFDWVYGLLEDNVSRNQLYNIVNFRLSYDLNFMRGFSAIEDKQYFEDFLVLKEFGESFVDVGAFDGFTTEEFIKRCPQYESIYLFEPEGKNINIAKDRLALKNNIHYFQNGLSDKKTTLRFSSDGSSSMVCKDGEIYIDVDKLDSFVESSVTFIKMDIEGGEHDAIKGAEETIRKYHPRLAISVYHKPNDLWKIPEQILSIRNDYKIYLRHYTEGISETVMFFIPSHFK